MGGKIIFLSWFVVTIIASTLGFVSYWGGKHLVWIFRLAGGLQPVHWIKYFAAVYMASTIIVHIYMVLSHDLSKLQAMITGLERIKRDKNKC